MSELLLIARCALALVFAIAAVGKLADLAGARLALAEFGLPPSIAGPGAVVLPVAELAVAALLVPTATARTGALGALVLLLAFCLAIGRVLRRGELPDCNCFGGAHSSPVGSSTLVRNGALAALAVLVLTGGAGTGLGEAVAGIDAAPLAIAVVAGFALQAWFSWQLFRQHGRLIERVRVLEAAAETDRPASLTVIHRHRPARASADQRLRVLEG